MSTGSETVSFITTSMRSRCLIEPAQSQSPAEFPKRLRHFLLRSRKRAQPPPIRTPSTTSTFPAITPRETQRKASFHWLNPRKDKKSRSRSRSRAESLLKKMTHIVRQVNADETNEFDGQLRSCSRRSRRAGVQPTCFAVQAQENAEVVGEVRLLCKRAQGEQLRLDYSDTALEQLANNDISPYLDPNLTPKQQFTLSSMKATFLRSKFLTHQRLLNVFKD